MYSEDKHCMYANVYHFPLLLLTIFHCPRLARGNNTLCKGIKSTVRSRKPALPRLLPIDPRFFSAFPRLEKRGKNAKSIWRLLLRQLSSSWLSFHQTANCWWLSLSLGFALGLSSLGLEQPASGGLSLTADRGSGKVLRLGLNFRVNKRQTGDG